MLLFYSSLERLDTTFILGQFDDDYDKSRAKYQQYVVNNINMKSPLEDTYKGIVLGKESFIEKVKNRIGLIGIKREIKETKIIDSHTADEIINKIIDSFAMQRESIFLKHKGNIYRQMALYLIKKYTNLSLKEIGQLFNMDYVAVSMGCKRFEEKILKSKTIQDMITLTEQMLNVKT